MSVVSKYTSSSSVLILIWLESVDYKCRFNTKKKEIERQKEKERKLILALFLSSAVYMALYIEQCFLQIYFLSHFTA